MTTIIVITVAAVAGSVLLIVAALIAKWQKRKHSSKYDNGTKHSENEMLMNNEIGISDLSLPGTKLASIQPGWQDTTQDNKEIGKERHCLCGYLYFTIKYNDKRCVLIVKLIKGENIPTRKAFPSKPFVEVQVLPVKAEPTYRLDGIEFPILSEELFCQTVHFCICRYDKFSRKTTIGDVFLSLAQLTADKVELTNETFMKIQIEPNVEVNIPQKKSGKELWEILRRVVLSGKLSQLKRRSFVEPLEWDTHHFEGDKAGSQDEGKEARETMDPKRRKSVKSNGPLGKLLFSLKYDEKGSLLLVRIMKAVDIPDHNGKAPSVMIECALLSGIESEGVPCQTSVQENTFTPVFEAIFEYKVDYDDLWKKKLRLLVWYVDVDSQLISLGEVVHSLSHLDIEGFNISETAMLFSKSIVLLQTKDSPPEDTVEDSNRVLLSLTYLPATNRIVVLVLKARDLKPTAHCRGVYVEVTVLHHNLRYRKVTSFKTESRNPHFNDALLFELKDVLINEIRLQVTVFQKESMGSDIPLAKIHLGKDAGGSGESHWAEALNAAKPIAQWHNLQPCYHVKALVQGISTIRTKEIHPSFGFPKTGK